MNDDGDTLARRILRGLSGQVFARASNAIYTVALVPVLVKAWGVQAFGEWIALLALLSYASYASFGLVTIGGNEIVMALASKDLKRAQLAYRMSINVVLYILSPVLIGIGLLAEAASPGDLLKLAEVPRRDATAIAWLALLQILLVTLRNLEASLLAGRGRYARAYLSEGAARLIELTLVGVAVLGFGAHQVLVAAIMCSVAGAELLAMVLLARNGDRWPTPDLRVFELRWIKDHWRPALGFTLSNLSTQSVLLQGPRVALGVVSGGHAVAIYSVYATALRLVDQAVLLLASPLEVEVAQSDARGDIHRAYRLIILGTQYALLAFLSASAVLMIGGLWLFPAWTAGRVSFEPGLMLTFVLMAGSAQIGRVSAHALIGANRIFKPARAMLPLAIVGLAFGAFLAGDRGAYGMALGVMAGELAISVVLVRAMTAWMARDPRDFGRRLVSVTDATRQLRAGLDRLTAAPP